MAFASWIAVTDDTGTKRDGTIFNLALTNSLRTILETNLFGATTPSRTPAQTTDEVIAARDGEASLLAKLDALEAAFTAGNVSLTEAQSMVVSRDVVLNGSFDDWTAGASAAPDNWTLTSLTIARTATTFSASSKATGQYVARLTRSAGVDGYLSQDIIAAASFANVNRARGLNFTAVVSVKASSGSQARIVVYDGVTQTASTYHTGDGTVRDLSVVHPIDSGATQLTVRLQVNTVNGDVDFGGVIGTFSDLAPSHWSPLTGIGYASATSGGLLSIIAQSIKGLKTFIDGAVFTVAPVGIHTFARCTASLTKNANITPANITGLAFAVGANEVWAFQFHLRGISSSTANFRFALTGPAAPTAVWIGGQPQIGVAGGSAAAAFSTDFHIIGLTGAPGVNAGILLSGLLRNGANAGTVQLQMAQDTSEAADTIIFVESYVIADRIS